MDLTALQNTLANFYNVAYGGAKKNIDLEAEAAKKDSLRRSAAMGTAGSGSAEAGAMLGIDKTKMGTLGSILANLKTAEAGAVANEFGAQNQRDWQSNEYMKQRKYQVDDTKRDAIFNLLSLPMRPVTGMFEGLGQAVEYNITDALTNRPDLSNSAVSIGSTIPGAITAGGIKKKSLFGGT